MNWKCFVFLFIVAFVTSPALAVEPVIHYKFDNSLANSGTGGEKYDAKVYGTKKAKDAKQCGSIAYVDGPDGTALDLCNHKGFHHGTFIGVEYTMKEQGTIAMWYYAGGSRFYNYEAVFDGINEVAKPGKKNKFHETHWEAWIYSTGLLRARIGNQNSNNFFQTVSTDLLALGGTKKWYHIAITWDKNDKSTENMKLYINGQLHGGGIVKWEDPPKIFCFAGGNTANQVGIGQFDDLKIYESVLPEKDVAKLVGTVKPVEIPKPVIHYTFEDDMKNSGTGGKDFDGELVDGPSGELSYTEGVKGKGLSCDNPADESNDGDHLKIKYTLPDEGAISVWYLPNYIADHNTIWDGISGWDKWKCEFTKSSHIRASLSSDRNGTISKKTNTIQKEATGDSAGWEEEWYHITYVWSKQKKMATLYVDGRLVSMQPIQNWVDPGSEFYLGGGHAWNDYGVGVFDEFKIFKNYLTSAQVKKMYDSTRPKSKLKRVHPKDEKKDDKKKDDEKAKSSVKPAAPPRPVGAGAKAVLAPAPATPKKEQAEE